MLGDVPARSACTFRQPGWPVHGDGEESKVATTDYLARKGAGSERGIIDKGSAERVFSFS